jgi:HPt (histidine-containing phosphotransfer) domain-containing protein
MAKYQVDIDKEFEMLIPLFIKTKRDDINKLKEELSKGDYEKIRFIGHQIKGAGYGYGFTYIGDLGSQLEERSLSGDEKNILSLIRRLEDYLEGVEINYIDI